MAPRRHFEGGASSTCGDGGLTAPRSFVVTVPRSSAVTAPWSFAPWLLSEKCDTGTAVSSTCKARGPESADERAILATFVARDASVLPAVDSTQSPTA